MENIVFNRSVTLDEEPSFLSKIDCGKVMRAACITAIALIALSFYVSSLLVGVVGAGVSIVACRYFFKKGCLYYSNLERYAKEQRAQLKSMIDAYHDFSELQRLRKMVEDSFCHVNDLCEELQIEEIVNSAQPVVLDGCQRQAARITEYTDDIIDEMDEEECLQSPLQMKKYIRELIQLFPTKETGEEYDARFCVSYYDALRDVATWFNREPRNSYSYVESLCMVNNLAQDAVQAWQGSIHGLKITYGFITMEQRYLIGAREKLDRGLRVMAPFFNSEEVLSDNAQNISNESADVRGGRSKIHFKKVIVYVIKRVMMRVMPTFFYAKQCADREYAAWQREQTLVARFSRGVCEGPVIQERESLFHQGKESLREMKEQFFDLLGDPEIRSDLYTVYANSINNRYQIVCRLSDLLFDIAEYLEGQEPESEFEPESESESDDLVCYHLSNCS